MPDSTLKRLRSDAPRVEGVIAVPRWWSHSLVLSIFGG